MYLIQRVQRVRRKETPEPHERRPQAPMHVGHLPSHETTDEDVLGIAKGTRERKDFVALGVTPPASTDSRARNGLGEIRHRTPCALENHAVATDEGQRCFIGHS